MGDSRGRRRRGGVAAAGEQVAPHTPAETLQHRREEGVGSWGGGASSCAAPVKKKTTELGGRKDQNQFAAVLAASLPSQRETTVEVVIKGSEPETPTKAEKKSCSKSPRKSA